MPGPEIFLDTTYRRSGKASSQNKTNTYLQGSDGDADREKRFVDTVGGRSRWARVILHPTSAGVF